MSILHQSTSEYLQDRLDTIRANILINQQNGIDENDALLLEDFFRIIAFGQGIDNPLAGVSLQERIDTLKKYNIPIDTLRKDISGFAFEDWVQDIIESSMNLFSENDIVSWSSMVKITGKDQFNLYEKIADPVIKSAVAKAYKGASQTFKKMTDENNERYRLNTQVFGKIDTGNLYFNLELNTEDPYLQEIIPLLAQSTFTDKGYLTKHDVRIGQTNPFRVFMAVSNDVDYNLRLRHWYAMLSCMEEHNSHGAPRLFYELRYIYELTGYGGFYIRKEIQDVFARGARFFLYLSNGVLKVIPVSRILVKLNQKLNSGKLIKQQQINRDYALYAILKMRLTATDPISFELE